jgi:hypothetical protein
MSLTLTLKRGGGGEVSGSGTNIELEGTIAGGAIESVEMYGDTEQTTYSGKNLYEGSPSFNSYNNLSAWEDGGTYNGMPVIKRAAAWSGAYRLINIEAGVTYTFSAWVKSDEARTAAIYAIGSGATATIAPNNKNITTTTSWERVSFTFTCSTSGTVALRFENASASTTNYTYISGYQLEKNSSMTSYEPYVGGTASPNPDYPQEVQTVTGEQTITISDENSQSQSYTVDLGSIELCKIGTYQDYIYKSGEDWYIHKETKKDILDGTENWIDSSTSGYTYIRGQLDGFAPVDSSCFCNMFTRRTGPHGQYEYIWVQPTSGTLYLQVSDSRLSEHTLAAFKTWLETNRPVVYSVLATPTDTQITDSTLIGQLNALNAGETYDGTTLITVSSENLVGSLEVKALLSAEKTYTEVEIGSPFTISDVEGKSSTTTLNGNVYVDFAYSKKAFQVDIFNLSTSDYSDIRDFYDYQFTSGKFITLSIPELSISNMPVYMEISKRNIVNQCLTTDKLTLNFRETVQP